MPGPLAGKTVAVTRARSQPGKLAGWLRELGANVLDCPLIRVALVEDTGPLDQRLLELASFDWVAFTSANAVDFFAARLAELGLDPVLTGGHPAIAAVGKGTAAALSRRGLPVELVAPEAVADSLAGALAERGVRGRRVLFPKARAARETLPAALAEAGAAVVSVVLYDTLPDAEGAGELRRAIGSGALDAVTVASASAVEQLQGVLSGATASFALVSIGPVTTARAEALGLRVAATAREHTEEGLLSALRWVLPGL